MHGTKQHCSCTEQQGTRGTRAQLIHTFVLFVVFTGPFLVRIVPARVRIVLLYTPPCLPVLSYAPIRRMPMPPPLPPITCSRLPASICLFALRPPLFPKYAGYRQC